ncbi:hypothetical protein GCM10027418_24230 [Mariniluteicoccus endophyticus]
MPSAWHKFYSGMPISLADVEVVCSDCNIARGSSRPGTKRYQEWLEDNRIEPLPHLVNIQSRAKEYVTDEMSPERPAPEYINHELPGDIPPSQRGFDARGVSVQAYYTHSAIHLLDPDIQPCLGGMSHDG